MPQGILRSILCPVTYNILNTIYIIISTYYNRTNKNCSDWISDFLSEELIFFDDFEHRFDLLLGVLALLRFGWDPSRETCFITKSILVLIKLQFEKLTIL
jgi:hypothetical protein